MSRELRRIAVLCVFATACATLGTAQPQKELVITGLSASKNPELAKKVAQARAVSRAGLVKSNVRFVLDRSRGKPMLKLVGEQTSAGISPDFEARKPAGQKALIRLQRTQAELDALSGLKIAHVEAEAAGLDLAVAQDRADRALFREAILRFAAAEQVGDPQLYGALTIVNYSAKDEGDRVSVNADIHVKFGDRSSTLSERTERKTFSEDQEEVPEENIELATDVQGEAAPASTEVKP